MLLFLNEDGIGKQQIKQLVKIRAKMSGPTPPPLNAEGKKQKIGSMKER
jgi:hypothetical protein